MSRFLKIAFISVLLLLMFSACSTQRNTWLNRNMHNMRAFYNIYWNGRETYRELLIKIEGLGYDNHSHVLRVFEYGSILDTAQTNPYTLRMIEKATKAAQNHSIRVRGVEYVRTMERTYMLMGIGHFYQHNFSMARTVFNFVISQFSDRPVRFEALLWSARTYIQEGEFELAATLISQVRNNEASLMRQTRRELPAVTADFFIAQNRYSEAIPFLQEAMRLANTRDFRNRLEFILAQIFQLEGRLQEAFIAYRNVLRRNPNMELEYNARINMALSYGGGYADRRVLAQQLKRMLQDSKNERFFGRIYFVLADMALRDGDIEEGIEYLSRSVEFSAINREQLAVSAIRLADLYFDELDYISAQRYYRRAASVMTNDHPDFYRVNTRAQNLEQLVRFLDIVRYEEQMQHLADLPEERREAEIDRLIEDYLARAEASAERAPRVLAQAPTQVHSTWYFHNEQARTFGAAEFTRRWGRRDNEDFWFLQQRPVFAISRDIEEDIIRQHVEEEEQRTIGDYTRADRAYYLANMPVGSAARERSNRRLEDNLFLLGIGYFDLVEEPELGIQTLERLLERFPNTHYRLQAFHYLYRMNLVLGNQAGRNKYRALLLAEFPNADLTREITDPDFHRIARENTRRAEMLYQHTFEAYQIGAFDVVLWNVQEAERRYPGNALMPRFRYLEAMASGAQHGITAMIQNLEQFIRDFHHERDLADLARTTIEFLSQGLSEDQLIAISEMQEQQAEEQIQEPLPAEPQHDISMFTFNPAAPHYTLVFVNVPEVNADFLKIRLADFNRRSFPQDNLRIAGEVWDNSHYLIYIHTHGTVSIAEGFLENLQNSRYVFGAIPTGSFRLMIISEENFQTLMRLRNLDVYLYFYEQYYNP
ncbi:MAG: tetratricopeptide repeat protein [Bacteroidales bacterium]|nr:tetratricopeptide repeat protein [Bacteroidales bacterium]